MTQIAPGAAERRTPVVVTTPLTASPKEHHQYSNDLVTLAAPLSPEAESIRALRTHVLAQHVQAGRRALAICAPSVGVGCTFLAANLAVALAQVGIKTLLVDGDLRTPGVQDVIKPASPAPGLAACLSAPGSDIGAFINPDAFPNLSIFYAGAATASAQELLANEWFEEVMNHCLREYEVTIIDTPPANTCADGRRISNVVGYGLIVARRNVSLVADVKILATQLVDDHVKIIGTIMKAD